MKPLQLVTTVILYKQTNSHPITRGHKGVVFGP